MHEKLMKLIYAIIRSEDELDVIDSLTIDGFSVTKIASSGGFLKRGNTTLMIGTKDEDVSKCTEIIKRSAGPHQKININMPFISGGTTIAYNTVPTQVEVGGATIFVLPVEQFIKY